MTTRTIGLALVGAALAVVLARPAAAQAVRGPDTVLVRSGGLRLKALLWRPAGAGPFPAVLFLHGSGPQLYVTIPGSIELKLGPLFARHGYAFLFLFRRGVGLSRGPTPGPGLAPQAPAGDQDARNQRQLQLLQTEALDDALAGLATLCAQPDVDRARVAVVGHSFGGMLALLLAERDSSLRAVVDFAGAAMSWRGSPPLRARLQAAVRQLTVPVFFIHAANDYSIAPGETLSAEMFAQGRPGQVRIYPAFGSTPEAGHAFIYLDTLAWEDHVFGFLDEHVRR